MAECLILEFDGVGAAEYAAVSRTLGIDVETGEGDWPAGLLFHAGGAKAGGGFMIVEVWDSKASNEAFFAERLGAAMAAHTVPAPTRMEWLDLSLHHTA